MHYRLQLDEYSQLCGINGLNSRFSSLSLALEKYFISELHYKRVSLSFFFFYVVVVVLVVVFWNNKISPGRRATNSPHRQWLYNKIGRNADFLFFFSPVRIRFPLHSPFVRQYGCLLDSRFFRILVAVPHELFLVLRKKKKCVQMVFEKLQPLLEKEAPFLQFQLREIFFVDLLLSLFLVGWGGGANCWLVFQNKPDWMLDTNLAAVFLLCSPIT